MRGSTIMMMVTLYNRVYGNRQGTHPNCCCISSTASASFWYSCSVL